MACRIIFAIPLLAAATLATPARAEFKLCNETDYPIAAAIGRNDGVNWRSEGWWIVPPQGCRKLIKGALKARYYYLHAIHLEVGGVWDGDRYFCVSNQPFAAEGMSMCAERGMRRVGFFEIDTGDDESFTQFLSD